MRWKIVNFKKDCICPSSFLKAHIDYSVGDRLGLKGGEKSRIEIYKFEIPAGLVTKSCPTLATPWTVDCQAPLSLGFSRQEYYGLPFPSPGNLPDPGIKPVSPALQADSLSAEIQGKPLKYLD